MQSPWRVFISRTSELAEFPGEDVGGSFVAAAKRAIERAMHAVIDMSNGAASPSPPSAISKRYVLASDVYVGIFGFRYGTLVRDEPLPSRSYTELEFDTAAAVGKPRLIFLLSDDLSVEVPSTFFQDSARDRQDSLRRRAREDAGLTVTTVRSPGDLEIKLYQALRDLAQSMEGQAASSWSLEHDPEFNRHWGPRSRGVAVDAEEGDRFRGRRAAFSRIRSWFDDVAPTRRIMAVTGSPGVGKSAILGRIVVDSAPEAIVKRVPDGAAQSTRGDWNIHCAVHARAKTSLDVAREIIRAVNGSPIDQIQDLMTSLPDALEHRRLPAYNIVVDALDEARSSTDTRSIVRDILLPIAEFCGDHNVRILIGTRQRDDEGSILRLLANAAEIVDLDEPQYFELHDLESYSIATLQLEGSKRPSVYSDVSIARPVAERIAALAAPNFLVAGLVARSHGLYDQNPVSPDEIVFTGSVEDAFQRYLQRIPAVDGVAAEEILTGLALAEPPGLTYELWQLAVEVLTERRVGLASLRKFSRTAAANFLIEESDVRTDRTYTLYHQALNESLVSWRSDLGSSRKQDEGLFASALLELGQTGGWERAPEYLLRSLSTHARRGGVIDDVLSDREFLLYADLGRLLSQISDIESGIAITRRRLLRSRRMPSLKSL